MAQSDTLQQAAVRLDAAVDALEGLFGSGIEIDKGEPVAALKEQVRVLTLERERLLSELQAERNRTVRLESAHDEVSGRLEALAGTLRQMMPAMPG